MRADWSLFCWDQPFPTFLASLLAEGGDWKPIDLTLTLSGFWEDVGWEILDEG